MRELLIESAIVLIFGASAVFLFSCGVAETVNKSLNVRCGGGVTELPPSLHGTWLFAGKSVYLDEDAQELKHPVSFFAYSIDTDDTDDSTRMSCDDAGLSSDQKIDLAPPEINSILRRYISAKISNELSLSKASTFISQKILDGDGRIEVCLTIQCGLAGGSLSETQSYANDLDIKAIQNYADTLLTADAFNDLQEYCKSAAGVCSALDENTMAGMLVSARTNATAAARGMR